MIAGLMLILIGLIIFVYPQFLVMLLAGLFIMAGITTIAVSMQFRKMRRQPKSAVVSWITRY
jgi:uncharacterized membrane protein HdeD (DUF308 family)